MDEDLGGRFRVGQRTVAGLGSDSEEVRERGEADPPASPFEQPTRERRGAERGLGESPPVPHEELLLEEALVEAGVVRDEQVVTGEREEPLEDVADSGRAAELLLSQPGEAGNGLGERDARIDERLERVGELERLHPNRPELADLVARRREPGRLQVEDDEDGLLEQGVVARRGQRHRAAHARDPAVTRDHLFDQRGGEAVRDRGRREERPRRIDDGERSALLEDLHEPVECVESQLHS